MKRSFEVETKTTKTATRTTIISMDSMQDESCLSEIGPSQAASVSQRDLEDDWFILFNVIPQEAVVMPPGTCDY